MSTENYHALNAILYRKPEKESAPTGIQKHLMIPTAPDCSMLTQDASQFPYLAPVGPVRQPEHLVPREWPVFCCLYSRPSTDGL
jgi:hypothetical protein